MSSPMSYGSTFCWHLASMLGHIRRCDAHLKQMTMESASPHKVGFILGAPGQQRKPQRCLYSNVEIMCFWVCRFSIFCQLKFVLFQIAVLKKNDKAGCSKKSFAVFGIFGQMADIRSEKCVIPRPQDTSASDE